MKRLIKKMNKIAAILIFAVVITSMPSIGAGNKAQAAITAGNVVYEGNGSLSCGSATLTLSNAVLTYTGATTNKYWSNPVAGTMVITQSERLAHVFWYSGIYFVIDMDNGTIVQAYKNSSNSYCIKSSGTAVYGSSAYMATINTCIIDDEWFYQENMAKMQRLMTRAEFDRISKGEDPTAPTQAPTPVPTATPTATPTVAPTATPVPTVAPTATPVPTVAPTATPVPTVAPTATPVPTVAPTATPTVAPTATPDIKIDFNFTFWWNQYISGKITWDQLTQIVWNNKWTVDSQTNEKETTYYFYDESGKLVKTERVLISNKHDDGSGNGSANASNSGSADIDISNNGTGGATGTVTVDKKTSTTSSSSSKSKITYHVKRPQNSNWVTLTRDVNSKTGAICKIYYNKKKKVAKFDGTKYTKIIAVGYTSQSRQIVLVSSQKDKSRIIPRAKGALGKVYAPRYIKGKWKAEIEDVRGLTLRLSNKKGKVIGVKNLQPRKIKK